VLTANDVGGDKVKLVCKYIDAADKTSHVFMATVPREQAVRMGLVQPALAASAPASVSASVAPSATVAPSASTPPVVGSSAKPAASAVPVTSSKPAKK